jgi:hypothetical protein
MPADSPGSTLPRRLADRTVRIRTSQYDIAAGKAVPNAV